MIVARQERYKHIIVKEKESWDHSWLGFGKRKCHKCNIECPNGLELTYGVNQLFFCRVCAFSKSEALKCWEEHFANKRTNSTGAR